MKNTTVFMKWLFLYGTIYCLGEKMPPVMGIHHIVTVFSISLYWIFLFAYLRKHGALKKYLICVPENTNFTHYLIYMPLLFAPLLNMAATAGKNISTEKSCPDILIVLNLLTVIFLCISCVIGEEVLFRGILLCELTDRCPMGAPAAIAATSSMFAVMHLLNMVPGEPVPYTLTQSVTAGAIGVCLAVVSIREHSIIPGIVIHSLTNLTSLYQERTETFGAKTDSSVFTVLYLKIFIVLPLLYLLWGIYLYQNKKGWKQL